MGFEKSPWVAAEWWWRCDLVAKRNEDFWGVFLGQISSLDIGC